MNPRLLLLSIVVLLTACSKHDHDHAGDHDHHGHAHTAPHGGTLVEIGEHQFNVELLLDPAAGKLTAWLLDAHAEHFVRSPLPALEVVLQPNGTPRPLTLLPVANSATGETIGNTSQFEATAEWLRGAGPLAGEFPRLEFRGAVFSAVKFKVSPATATSDHSAHAH
jgi:hypothetical protein